MEYSGTAEPPVVQLVESGSELDFSSSDDEEGEWEDVPDLPVDTAPDEHRKLADVSCSAAAPIHCATGLY